MKNFPWHINVGFNNQWQTAVPPRSPFKEGCAEQLWGLQAPATIFFKVCPSCSFLAQGQASPWAAWAPCNYAWGPKDPISPWYGTASSSTSHPRTPCQAGWGFMGLQQSSTPYSTWSCPPANFLHRCCYQINMLYPKLLLLSIWSATHGKTESMFQYF